MDKCLENLLPFSAIAWFPDLISKMSWEELWIKEHILPQPGTIKVHSFHHFVLFVSTFYFTFFLESILSQAIIDAIIVIFPFSLIVILIHIKMIPLSPTYDQVWWQISTAGFVDLCCKYLSEISVFTQIYNSRIWASTLVVCTV